MPEVNDYDIIICGSGPAGAATALALRGSGLRVAILDRAVFPRDKVCGDAIPGGAVKALAALSPQYLEEFLSFSKRVTIQGVRLVSPSMRELEVRFARQGHVCMRLDFDHWLREIAIRDSGAQFYSPAEVKQVTPGEKDVEVTLADGRIFRCAVIIGADGAQSVIARTLAGFQVEPRHYCGAVRAYYKNVESVREDFLEVYFLKGYLPGYFWIFPLPDRRANVGFGMLTETISAQKIDLKKSLDAIVKEFPQLKERFKGAEREGGIQGFGLPLGSRKRALSGSRWMLIGDAASLIDPFSGEGIGNAMWSGMIAAEHAQRMISSGDFSTASMKQYDTAVYAKFWKSLKTSYRFQRLLNNRPWLVNGLVRIAGNNRFIRNWLHKIM